MKKITFIFSFFISIITIAQEKTNLVSITKKLYSVKTDSEKQKYNQELLTAFEKVLNEPNSFDKNFDSLKNDIGILFSPDNKFKIINWNVPKNDGTQEYYGFIQEKYSQVIKKGLFKKEHLESMQLYPLIDKSLDIKNADNYVSDNKKWFGMLYNKIIVKKSKKQTYYTLLAWDGNDKFSSKKIIDVLTFDNMGVPHFGAAIFNMEKKYPKRIIFEYAANCNMSLKFNTKKDSIIFDHLAPTEPQLEGQFQYYCSDMSYDGFGFKNGKWNYGTDLNATNEKTEQDKHYNDPHDRTHTHNESDVIIKRREKKKSK
jgi:hypothetical protein